MKPQINGITMGRAQQAPSCRLSSIVLCFTPQFCPELQHQCNRRPNLNRKLDLYLNPGLRLISILSHEWVKAVFHQNARESSSRRGGIVAGFDSDVSLTLIWFVLERRDTAVVPKDYASGL